MNFHLRMVRYVKILLVYRPPGLSTSLFLEEFSKLLEHITADLRHKRLLIVGDFNIHVMLLLDNFWTCWTPLISYSMSERKHMLMDTLLI